MKNSEIRQEIKSAGLRLWQIAEALGMRDAHFYRSLRDELNENEKQRIRRAIARCIAADAEKTGGTVRLRFPAEALAELKKLDPETPVSLPMLRRLIREGKVPSVPVGSGKRRLVNPEAVIAYLENTSADERW